MTEISNETWHDFMSLSNKEMPVRYVHIDNPEEFKEAVEDCAKLGFGLACISTAGLSGTNLKRLTFLKSEYFAPGPTIWRQVTFTKKELKDD